LLQSKYLFLYVRDFILYTFCLYILNFTGDMDSKKFLWYNRKEKYARKRYYSKDGTIPKISWGC